MRTYFADTSYSISVLVPTERFHANAVALAARQDIELITTDYVLLELSAYFAKPPHRAIFVSLVEQLRRASRITVIPSDAALFQRGWELYWRHIDKAWSLVDCTSFVVMRDQGIDTALSTDHHFEQAGFQILLKTTPS